MLNTTTVVVIGFEGHQAKLLVVGTEMVIHTSISELGFRPDLGAKINLEVNITFHGNAQKLDVFDVGEPGSMDRLPWTGTIVKRSRRNDYILIEPNNGALSDECRNGHLFCHISNMSQDLAESLSGMYPHDLDNATVEFWLGTRAGGNGQQELQALYTRLVKLHIFS